MSRDWISKLFGLHEHGRIHKELNCGEKWTLMKISPVFRSRERDPLVLILQNSLQQSWVPAIPLAKAPAPSCSCLHRHKALARVLFQSTKTEVRAKASLPRDVHAQSCDWGFFQSLLVVLHHSHKPDFRKI